jgi:hypothetical protein
MRLNSVPKDWRGFDRSRLLAILRGLVGGAEIEPVPLIELEPGNETVWLES